jgi:hypothetical protein
VYGNIVSSNGLIDLGQDIEKEIKFENPIYFLSVIIENDCMIYLNDDPDGIYLPAWYTQPFMIKDLPIFKFKICRHGESLKQDTDEKYGQFTFSFYGYY